jgi:hypothetical protein
MKDIDAMDFDLDLVGCGGGDVNVGFAEDDEEVSGSGVGQIGGHVEVGVHAGFEDADATELGEFGGVGIVAEGAGDEDIKSGFSSFFGSIDKIDSGDGAKFGADENSRAFFAIGFTFEVATFSADVFPRPSGEASEVYFAFFVGLLDSSGFEVGEDDFGEVGGFIGRIGFVIRINQFVVFINGNDAVRREAFDGEGASDADGAFVFVGFVIEVFLIGFGRDRCVNLFLSRNAIVPPVLMEFLGFFGPGFVGFAGDLPFFPVLFEGGVELGAEGFEFGLEFFPDHIDFGIVGDRTRCIPLNSIAISVDQ